MPRGCSGSRCAGWPRSSIRARRRCTSTWPTPPSCTRRSSMNCWARSTCGPAAAGGDWRERIEAVLGLLQPSPLPAPEPRAVGTGRPALGPQLPEPAGGAARAAQPGRRAGRPGGMGRGRPAPGRHRQRGRACRAGTNRPTPRRSGTRSPPPWRTPPRRDVPHVAALGSELLSGTPRDASDVADPDAPQRHPAHAARHLRLTPALLPRPAPNANVPSITPIAVGIIIASFAVAP